MRLDQVVLRRPIARWIGERKVAACPSTKEIVEDTLGTPMIPRSRIAGQHVNAIRAEAIPVRGYRCGRIVLPIAPEHVDVDVHDPSEHEKGEPITAPWVPLVAVFSSRKRGAVVVPRKEVDL